ASYNGHLEVVQLLLDKGANVKATTSQGWTPLHWASYNGQLEVGQLLLDKGGDANGATSVGSETVYRCSSKDHFGRPSYSLTKALKWW
ncbi:ankyrin repeat-containing domain protein, partial [Amylocarpus encephaloides]